MLICVVMAYLTGSFIIIIRCITTHMKDVAISRNVINKNHNSIQSIYIMHDKCTYIVISAAELGDNSEAKAHVDYISPL